MDSTRFVFLSQTEEGGAVYVASHEIWNTVRIALPRGYFENLNGSAKWPPAIVVQSFVVLPCNTMEG